MKTVAITGASSFTGLWICQAFQAQGWKTHALLSLSGEKDYLGLKGMRVKSLKQDVPVYFGVRAENNSMVQWINQHKPSIWVHHHHWMENFRSPSYDSARALQIGLEPLSELVKTLSQSGCQGIIYSGTFFEPEEGGSDRKGAPTPYAISKKVIWEHFHELATAYQIPISKIVIPDPVGPFENSDRMIPQLLKSSQNNSTFLLRSPNSAGDHIPVKILSESYVKCAEKLLLKEALIYRPSGWTVSNLDWVSVVNHELIVKRLGLPHCQIAFPSAKDKPVPLVFMSNQEGDLQTPDWRQFWDEYAHYLQSSGSQLLATYH